MSELSLPDTDATRSRNAAACAADGLRFAAAPAFALMALLTGPYGSEPNVLCVAAQGASSFSGMFVMYMLMSAFHSAPWLRLFSR